MHVTTLPLRATAASPLVPVLVLAAAATGSALTDAVPGTWLLLGALAGYSLAGSA